MRRSLEPAVSLEIEMMANDRFHPYPLPQHVIKIVDSGSNIEIREKNANE